MSSMTDPQPARTLLRTMRRVRSVRSFRPDPVPDEFLTEILEVARWTGSGSNRQPWTFVVVREPATLSAIAAASPNVRHVAGAAAAIVIVMDGGDTRDRDVRRRAGRGADPGRGHRTGPGLGHRLDQAGRGGRGRRAPRRPGGPAGPDPRFAGLPDRGGGSAQVRTGHGAATLSRTWCASSGSPEVCSASRTPTGPVQAGTASSVMCVRGPAKAPAWADASISAISGSRRGVTGPARVATRRWRSSGHRPVNT